MKDIKYRNYLIGFSLSLVLTMAAYLLTQHHLDTGHTYPSDNAMRYLLIGLALVQLMVQLYFFLHLGREQKPRWRSMTAVFAVTIVLILVIGSIWIMDNLNYRMTPQQINNYLKDQDGGI